jgi:hypothetical protein
MQIASKLCATVVNFLLDLVTLVGAVEIGSLWAKPYMIVLTK